MNTGTAAQPAPQDGQARDPHRSLHSETGSVRGEHSGRSNNPMVKVAGLAWLEFEKPDLERAERFLADFGFVVADRTPEACGCVAGGPARRACGAPGEPVAFRRRRLSRRRPSDVNASPGRSGHDATSERGATAVTLRDPSGHSGAVVHGAPVLPATGARRRCR